MKEEVLRVRPAALATARELGSMAGDPPTPPAGRFRKTLIFLSRCMISRMEVPETCSPDRWCTPTIGMK